MGGTFDVVGAASAGSVSIDAGVDVVGELSANSVLVDVGTVLTGAVTTGAVTAASISCTGQLDAGNVVVDATMDVVGQLSAGNLLIDTTAVVTTDATVSGDLLITGTTTHTGVVTHTAGLASTITGNLVGDVTGNVDGTVTGKTPSEAGDAMNLAADAIKAVSYDESTAFPLTAVNGSTLTEAGGDGDHLTAINLPNQTMDIIGTLTGNLIGDVTGNVDGTVAGQTPADAADVNAQVLDVLNVDTFAEPGDEVPASTTSLVDKIGYLYKFLRNKIETTATKINVYDDAGTNVDQTATISDDATTFTRGEFGAGE
jgi:hypothetical protein